MNPLWKKLYDAKMEKAKKRIESKVKRAAGFKEARSAEADARLADASSRSGEEPAGVEIVRATDRDSMKFVSTATRVKVAVSTIPRPNFTDRQTDNSIFEPKFHVPKSCPKYLKKVKSEYWYYVNCSKLMHVNYRIGNKFVDKKFELLEEMSDFKKQHFAFCCRLCKNQKIMAFYIADKAVLLAAPNHVHECEPGPAIKGNINEISGYKPSKGFYPIPSNMYIIPCDENNVIKDKIYLLPYRKAKKAREFLFLGMRMDSDLVFVCNYCRCHNKLVHAMVGFDDLIYVTAEDDHLQECSFNINMVKLLQNEVAVLTNPIF